MVFRGRYVIRRKIMINNKINRTNKHIYLLRMLTIIRKKMLKIINILREHMNHQSSSENFNAQKQTRLSTNNTLTYGRETWALNEKTQMQN
jgi:hypothetical protein